MVIHLHGEVAIGEEQVLQIEVADERWSSLCGVIAITELSVEDQTVVEHASVDDAFVFCIVPAFITCRDVSTEVPVVVLDDLSEQGVDLGGERTREETLHGQRGTIGLILFGIIGTLIIETSDGQQIDHLLVHLLLSVDDRADHLLLIGIHGRHLKVEVHLRMDWLPSDVHQAVHTDGVTTERIADIQVGETHTVDGIDSLQIQGSLM